MEKHALHIWPRGTFMMIALPNVDGSFTGTCFWPFTGPNSFSSLTSRDEVRAFFSKTFPSGGGRGPASTAYGIITAKTLYRCRLNWVEEACISATSFIESRLSKVAI
jgi:hypothetical protein